jgi:hypothetical protein
VFAVSGVSLSVEPTTLKLGLKSKQGAQIRQCYACFNLSTGKEHVPPKCLFPDASESTLDGGYRKNLITVDACDLHNSKKSKDDEYLLFILALSFTSNGVVAIEHGSKIWRAIDRNPSLAIRILNDSRPALLLNETSGVFEETGVVSIEEDRFYGHVQNMARALYFHVFDVRWFDDVFVYPEFLFPSSTGEGGAAMASHKKLVDTMKTAFLALPSIGSNPDVFSYKIVRHAKTGSIFMRLTFYGGCDVSVAFRSKPRTYGLY